MSETEADASRALTVNMHHLIACCADQNSVEDQAQ